MFNPSEKTPVVCFYIKRSDELSLLDNIPCVLYIYFVLYSMKTTHILSLNQPQAYSQKLHNHHNGKCFPVIWHHVKNAQTFLVV